MAFVQMPPQHSVLVLHTSPFCVQNEGWLEQTPLEHSDEQQSELAVQALPDVWHDVLSGVHVFAPPSVVAEHLPPQQLASAVHVFPSEIHRFFPQAPPAQTNVQHSFPVWHAVPEALHTPTGDAHFLLVASHTAEQQSAGPVHDIPTRPQVSASPDAALSPAEPSSKVGPPPSGS